MLYFPTTPVSCLCLFALLVHVSLQTFLSRLGPDLACAYLFYFVSLFLRTIEFPRFNSEEGRTVLFLKGQQYPDGSGDTCSSLSIVGGTGCFRGVPNSQVILRSGTKFLFDDLYQPSDDLATKFVLNLFPREIPEHCDCIDDEDSDYDYYGGDYYDYYDYYDYHDYYL